MSCVKLWLKTISKNKLEILKQFDNIVVYDLRGKSYSQICRAIFRNYYKNDVILVGKTKYELPIPKVRKNFTKDNIHNFLNSVTTATFSFRLKKPIRINRTEIKTYYGDTFKLWSKSHLLKTHMWNVDELFWLTFKTDDITKVKAWGIPLDELDKYPDHCQRLMKAKLSYPIYVYGNSVVDGYHRLIKAKLKGIKQIAYYNVTISVLKMCYINPTDLRKYYKGKGFVLN